MPQQRLASVATSEPTALATDASPQTTTAAFVDLGSAATKTIDRHGFATTAIRIINTHATLTASYRVMGSFDNTTYDIPVVASTPLAAVTTALITITTPVLFCKVQVIDGTGHATIGAQYTQRAS